MLWLGKGLNARLGVIIYIQPPSPQEAQFSDRMMALRMVTGIVPYRLPPSLGHTPAVPWACPKPGALPWGPAILPTMLEKLSNFHSKWGTCIHFIGQSFYLTQCVEHLEISIQISNHKTSLCDALELEYICLDLFKTNPRNPFVYSVLTGNLSQGGVNRLQTPWKAGV